MRSVFCKYIAFDIIDFRMQALYKLAGASWVCNMLTCELKVFEQIAGFHAGF